MKNSILLFVLLLSVVGATAQITYDPGYYINIEGDTISGLIRNQEWKNCPEKIEFKLTEHSEPVKLEIEKMLEFAVNGSLPFKRFTVQFDEYINRQDEVYSNNKQPDLKLKTLMLRQLSSGNVILYEYVSNVGTCYYISKDNSNPELLIFKYYLENESELNENNRFKAQMYLLLQCSCLKMENFENLSYNSKSLKSIIIKYNQCTNSSEQNRLEQKKTTKGKICFGVFAGAQLSGLRGSKKLPFFDMDIKNFPTYVSPVGGLDFEYFFPFNRKKFSFSLQPELSHYSASAILAGYDTKFKLTAVNIPIQIRYSAYLLSDTRIFGNFGFGVTFPLSYDFSGAFHPYYAHANLYPVAGLGVQMGNNYIVGFTQAFRHDYILYQSPASSARIFRTSINFIYRIK